MINTYNKSQNDKKVIENICQINYTQSFQTMRYRRHDFRLKSGIYFKSENLANFKHAKPGPIQRFKGGEISS